MKKCRTSAQKAHSFPSVGERERESELHAEGAQTTSLRLIGWGIDDHPPVKMLLRKEPTIITCEQDMGMWER